MLAVAAADDDVGAIISEARERLHLSRRAFALQVGASHTTAASILLDQGATVHQVQARLGHAKPSTTLNIYGHQITDAGREHSDLLAQALERPHSDSQALSSSSRNPATRSTP